MNKALVLGLLLSGCLMPRSGTSSSPSSPSSPSSSSSSSSTAPAATEPTDGSKISAPAAPQTVSVTIRSSCNKTVKVFYGDKPGFSSGTSSSLSSNSVQSKTFREGDQMWLTDDSGKGLSNVRIESSTRQIETTCGGISAK
jgi:hypothetical protein